ncbi:hypothetical protein C8A00DRAFT_40135 [Chaetomidium leptoderma]|uniref:Uncharacterized protein n=1 Tax=Chaetomidium leptoderma TaxID=669021 RepID=A0AAN6VWS5_9PEZI|nr:hypothetical protein C8A00DRAFT_40135 [Chaetomidium leptoderma]
MEFVLALEKPCLAHIHGDPENPQQANGHALTVTSHLLVLSPQPLSSPPSPELLNEACAKAPASILDRLLTLSTNLAVEGEVTPAQAWNRIRCQPQFDRLKADGLRAFTRKLGTAAKCHG